MRGFPTFWICITALHQLLTPKTGYKAGTSAGSAVVLEKAGAISQHTDNHCSMKCAHSDGQGGTGGEHRNSKAKHVDSWWNSAHSTDAMSRTKRQFASYDSAEQFHLWIWNTKRGSDKFHRQQNLPPFPREDFSAGLLQDTVGPAVKGDPAWAHEGCVLPSVSTKIQPSSTGSPPNDSPTAGTALGTGELCLTQSTQHTSPCVVSWMSTLPWSPRRSWSHSKSSCLSSRECFCLVIEEVYHISDLTDQASPVSNKDK